jgi:hypothetical protein
MAAYDLPGTKLLNIDLTETAVMRGRATVQALGLENGDHG